MRRVLVVSPSAYPGGAERALASLVGHLPARGFSPLVALLEPGPLETWLDATGCEFTIHPREGAPEPVRWIRNLALESGAELVLSNKSEGHVLGTPAADEAVLPAIWWQQNVAVDQPDERQAARLPVAVIVCNSDLAVAAQRAFAPEARIVRIHLGTPVAEIARSRGSGGRIRASMGWGTNPIVGVVGRIEPMKGQDTFVQAAGIVAESRPDVRFAVIGGSLPGKEPEFEPGLRNAAAELGLADRFVFTGHQDDVYAWFDALDVAVQTSRIDAFPLVVVEAMALGKPLVTTVAGDPGELVEDGVSGLRVPTGDPRAMAEAIGRILDDPSLAEALGREAGKRALRFTEEEMADRWAELFESLLAGEPSANG